MTINPKLSFLIILMAVMLLALNSCTKNTPVSDLKEEYIQQTHWEKIIANINPALGDKRIRVTSKVELDLSAAVLFDPTITFRLVQLNERGLEIRELETLVDFNPEANHLTLTAKQPLPSTSNIGIKLLAPITLDSGEVVESFHGYWFQTSIGAYFKNLIVLPDSSPTNKTTIVVTGSLLEADSGRIKVFEGDSLVVESKFDTQPADNSFNVEVSIKKQSGFYKVQLFPLDELGFEFIPTTIYERLFIDVDPPAAPQDIQLYAQDPTNKREIEIHGQAEAGTTLYLFASSKLLAIESIPDKDADPNNYDHSPLNKLEEGMFLTQETSTSDNNNRIDRPNSNSNSNSNPKPGSQMHGPAKSATGSKMSENDNSNALSPAKPMIDFIIHTPPLPDGVYTFKLRSEDLAGNLGAYAFSEKIEISTARPDAPSLISMTPPPPAHQMPEINLKIDDEAVGMKFFIHDFLVKDFKIEKNNGSFVFTLPTQEELATNLDPQVYGFYPFKDGLYKFSALVYDDSGNESLTSLIHEAYIYDATAPEITIDPLKEDTVTMVGIITSTRVTYHVNEESKVIFAINEVKRPYDRLEIDRRKTQEVDANSGEMYEDKDTLITITALDDAGNIGTATTIIHMDNEPPNHIMGLDQTGNPLAANSKLRYSTRIRWTFGHYLYRSWRNRMGTSQ